MDVKDINRVIMWWALKPFKQDISVKIFLPSVSFGSTFNEKNLLLGKVILSMDFATILYGRQLFWLFLVAYLCIRPRGKGSTDKGKNLLPEELIIFF